jgi:NADH-quinone oxidoreductase subunit M
VQVSFFGKVERDVPDALSANHPEAGSHHDFPPITWPEKAGALLLLSATIYIGLNPDALLNWIGPALESPLFRAALNGGAP